MKTKFTILLSIALLWMVQVFAQTSTTFSYTGAMQTYTIPAGVYSVLIDMSGASGGYSINGTQQGTLQIPGDGGRVEATLAVTPGQVLNIYVGGRGTDASTGLSGAGGYNGGGTGGQQGTYNGGGGGGASDIRIGGTALGDRVLVAGGGGGSALNYFAGGDNGGDGGNLTGQDGASNNNVGASYAGKAGSPSAGGAGGVYTGYNPGSAGSLGTGGDGGSGTSGGGGGAGLYGGGGGSWAGGGGGSSYSHPTLATNVTHTQGYKNGNGEVTVTLLCAQPQVTFSNSTTLCQGDTITLSGTSNGSGVITWDNGVTNGAVFTPPLGTTIYSLFSTDTIQDCPGYTVSITVNPVYSAFDTVWICQGGSYTFADSTTMDSINAAVTYVSQFYSNYGCDSTLSTTVNVILPTTTTENIEVCAGEDYVFPDGFTATNITGVVSHTSMLTSAMGCDSIVITTVDGTPINTLVTQNGVTLTAIATGVTYRWVDCNDNYAAVPGATNQSFTPVVNGTYAVIMNKNNCTEDTSACTTVIVLGTAPLQAGLSVKVYPNPARSQVKVDLSQVIENGTLELLSLQGQRLQQVSFTRQSVVELDLNQLATGVYFVRITTPTGHALQKLIIDQQ
ncbi:MAG: T9SS type A sorting domain-containing protein [Bacteroidia bacterium]|nr:T9SS type A sorting domain-containing protein [Bacteroidia bacterium]